VTGGHGSVDSDTGECYTTMVYYDLIIYSPSFVFCSLISTLFYDIYNVFLLFLVHFYVLIPNPVSAR